MKFFKKDLSLKLQEMGCVSESGHFYGYSDTSTFYCSGDISTKDFEAVKKGNHLGPFYYAFTELDFLGTSEIAKENCKKRFGEDIICDGCEAKYPDDQNEHNDFTILHYDCGHGMDAWEYHRHAMLDSPDGEEYLERGLK